MAKTAQRLNMFDAAGTENVEQLQRMQWAALQANIGNEEFTTALDKMNQVVGQAATQGGETAKVFTRLGLSVQALSGMGADKQFELIVKRLEGVSSASERARLVSQIWGRSAGGMQNLVARGWAQISADMNAATKYIVTDNKKIVNSCGAWDTAMKQLRATAMSTWRDGVIGFMPTITAAMQSLSEKIAANRERIMEVFAAFSSLASFAVPALTSIIGWVGDLAGTIGKSKVLVIGLSSAFAVFGLAATGIKLVTAAVAVWKTITAAATAAQWALNAAMTANPIGLVVAGIVAAVAAVAAAGYAIYKNWEPIKEFFTGLFAKLKNGFMAVVGWVKQGFTSAWEWLKNSAVFKAISWIAEKVFGVGGSLSAANAAAVPAAAPNPLPAGTLESMSRASVVNSRSTADNRTFSTNANITISQQPGEDAEALAERVSARLAENYSSTLAAAI